MYGKTKEEIKDFVDFSHKKFAELDSLKEEVIALKEFLAELKTKYNKHTHVIEYANTKETDYSGRV